MALGPGKYDDLATVARNLARARAVVLVVLDGAAGSGFSVQADQPMTAALPKLLRSLADQIEDDITKREAGDER